MGRGTTTATRVTETSITLKEMPLLQGIPQMLASNVEKKDTTLGTVQNADKVANTTKWLT